VGCGEGESATPPASMTMVLESAPASLSVGQTFQFTARVPNTKNTSATWSVGGVRGGNSTVGTISATGLYTAPASVPSPASVTITATSNADVSKAASVTVTISPLTTSPNAINVPGNNTDVAGVNLDISTSSPTLGLADVGTCTGTLTPTVGLTGCSGGVASVTISKGTTAIVWLLGQGLTNRDGTALASGLSVNVSQGTSRDVTVTQVTPLSPTDNAAGLINIAFQVTVSAGAAAGPRNIVVTNSVTGELQAFVGAIQI
jgi:hypothetical protein